MTDVRTRLASLLGPAATVPGAATLLGIGLVDSIGTGLYLSGAAIFFTLVIGLTAAQVGIGLSVAGVLGLLAQPVVGWLADRWGARRVLIAIHLWRACGFAAYAVTHTMAVFVVVAALLGIGEQAVNPVYQAFAEQLVGADARVAMMARTRAVYNVGFTVGALVATAVISIGTRAAYSVAVLGNAVSFIAAAVLMLTRVALRSVREKKAADAAPMRFRALRDGRYMAVAAVNGVIVMHIALLGIAMPLWVTLHTSVPRAIVGVLFALNTVLAVTLQVRASRGAETVAGSSRALQFAGLALAVCCGVFAAAARTRMTVLAVALLVLAVLALTAGELWQSAGGWGLSYALAPEASRAEHLSSFNLGTGVQYVLGPALVTVGVVSHGAAGWLAMAGVFLAAAAAVGPLARRAEARPRLRHDAAVRSVLEEQVG